jgi:hypothetical protein
MWDVFDIINNHPNLKVKFPDHNQQTTIAEGLKKILDTHFESVIGSIDDILIWFIEPSKAESK